MRAKPTEERKRMKPLASGVVLLVNACVHQHARTFIPLRPDGVLPQRYRGVMVSLAAQRVDPGDVLSRAAYRDQRGFLPSR